MKLKMNGLMIVTLALMLMVAMQATAWAAPNISDEIQIWEAGGYLPSLISDDDLIDPQSDDDYDFMGEVDELIIGAFPSADELDGEDRFYMGEVDENIVGAFPSADELEEDDRFYMGEVDEFFYGSASGDDGSAVPMGVKPEGSSRSAAVIPKTGDVTNPMAVPVLIGLAVMWLCVAAYVIKCKLYV